MSDGKWFVVYVRRHRNKPWTSVGKCRSHAEAYVIAKQYRESRWFAKVLPL